MTSANSNSPITRSSEGALHDDLLAEVAYWRARGASWEVAAENVQWEPAELRRLTRHDPDFERELDYATREYEREVEARAFQSLRDQMNGTDPRAALTAAKAVMTYLTRKYAERNRLELAYLRAEQEPPHAEPRRRSKEGGCSGQEEPAAELVREGAPVHLWGGCHKLTGAVPDHTDLPLNLVRSEPVPGRVIYWALTDPLPTRDPDTGPFLKPPGCKPNPVPG